MKKTFSLKTVLIIAMALASYNLSAAGLALSDCGVVVGHEMGLWEFLSIPPNPRQVERVLKSELKFVKISLRKLKDG
ncbi:MAG: hypothetical protein EHM20_09840, partial [Alphaproteobacteria bacterium]